MGDAGKYDNFSSSVLPEDYLPAFLAIKYPYAQEDDAITIVYEYYANYTNSLLADVYTYTDGVWGLVCHT